MLSASLLDAIGNTPVVELSYLSPTPEVRIYAKLEGCNPTGSVKDRVARYLVERAEAAGELAPGRTLVEASTGNTALALALVARIKGYRLTAVVPRRVTPGIGGLLETYGAEIVWCDFAAGMKGAIDLADQLAREEGSYATRQFESRANILAHYETTGPEVLRDVPRVDVFIAGIGTGGTLMGVGRRLKEHNAGIKVLGVEPYAGDQVQGLRSLSEGFVPPLLDLGLLDGRFLVDSRTAFAAMRRLLEAEGIFAGVSSGAVLHCALRVAAQMTRGTIVALFADHGWKYLATLPPAPEAAELSSEPDNTAWW